MKKMLQKAPTDFSYVGAAVTGRRRSGAVTASLAVMHFANNTATLSVLTQCTTVETGFEILAVLEVPNAQHCALQAPNAFSWDSNSSAPVCYSVTVAAVAL